MAYKDLKACTVKDMMHNQQVIDLVSIRHMQRQIMILDENEETLFNYEYPTFPHVQGLYSTTEYFPQDVVTTLEQAVQDGYVVTEIYFLGTRMEHEKIVDQVKQLQKKHPSLEKAQCFHVKPDPDSIRATVRVEKTADKCEKFVDEFNEFAADFSKIDFQLPDIDNTAAAPSE